MIGAVIGILFQPVLGRTIDLLGERFVLLSEAALLVFVCLGYGFSRFLVAENVAFIIAWHLFSAGSDAHVGQYGAVHVYEEDCPP